MKIPIQVYQIVPMAAAIILSVGIGMVTGYALGSYSEKESYPTSDANPYQELAAVSMPDLSYTSQATNIEADNTSPIYVLGIEQGSGFVAVFYYNQSTIKDLTRTPISALSPEEFIQLSEGIHIYTEEQLVKLLQDYDS